MSYIPREGDRIELVSMADDPHPIEAGSKGTVTRVQAMHWPACDWHQVSVDWDNGSHLCCVSPPDVLRLVLDD